MVDQVDDPADPAFCGQKKLMGWVRHLRRIALRMRIRSTPVTLWARKARRNAR
jgi:hypothetical protein